MQKSHGFAPLGAADGAVKRAIFGGNNARLYNVDVAAAERDIRSDKLTKMKAAYEQEGPARSNLRYGYATGSPIDHSMFV